MSRRGSRFVRPLMVAAFGTSAAVALGAAGGAYTVWGLDPVALRSGYVAPDAGAERGALADQRAIRARPETGLVTIPTDLPDTGGATPITARQADWWQAPAGGDTMPTDDGADGVPADDGAMAIANGYAIDDAAFAR